MSSYVGKIMERMINERIIWLVEREGWLDTNQNGFRRGRSCTDNLVRLITDVEINKASSQSVIAIFLDISSTYDNVRVNVLCDMLSRKNCPIRIVKYIHNWMKNRFTKFILSCDEEEDRIVNKGLPQGGVLSPIFYSIYTS